MILGLNQDQVLSILRGVLISLGGFVVAHGWASDATWSVVVGCVLAVIPVLWGAYVQSTSSKIASVATMPGATVVVDKNHPSVSTELVAAANDPRQPNVKLAP